MGSLNRTMDEVNAFEGGSFRQKDLGNGVFHCMPVSGIRRLSQRYELGTVKYENGDAYKDGLPTSQCFDHALKHLFEYLDGDNTEDHLAAAAWNILAIMEMEVRKPEWQNIKSRQGLPCNEYLEYTKEDYAND